MNVSIRIFTSVPAVTSLTRDCTITKWRATRWRYETGLLQGVVMPNLWNMPVESVRHLQDNRSREPTPAPLRQTSVVSYESFVYQNLCSIRRGVALQIPNVVTEVPHGCRDGPWKCVALYTYT